jgi:predicted ATPase/class 3 adenylate cyclase
METEHNFPTGTLTFLFTDIEQSTMLWERYGEGMRPALARHDALLRSAVEEHGGRVVKTTGDGLMAVFESGVSAQEAALAAQRRLHNETWQEITPDVLRVRMGLHSGEAQLRDHDYYGTTVNKAARIMDLGHGGQILLSSRCASFVEEDLPQPVALRDLGQHPLRGLRENEQIYQLLAPELDGDFPPLRSGKALAGNLPAHVSSFVGRNREMAEIRAALPRTRLLTITGPGGTGKTRLSLQVAADVQAQYDHGAWLVELAPLTDPDLIISAVAAVFDLQGQTRDQTREILFDYLREKEALLILDNCEHLVEASARLASDLIAASSRLTILASSREGLGVYGETTYHLPTLNLPAAEDKTAEAAGQSEAVQLFVERAAEVQPGFRLSDHNITAVVQIVRRLDGIPLALELAAARLNFFSVQQIAARLDDRFRLLTGGSRTALPRQQTLRALIDWSYDLLDESERMFFRRLSVFSGGWTFDAAESVAGSLDAFTMLPQLIAKSLVLRDQSTIADAEANENEASEPRYHYLETVRQYARDRLLESGEGEEARDRHFAYYEALGQTISFGFGPGTEKFRLDGPIQEHGNLRAAIEWGIGRYPDRVINLLWDFSVFLSDQLPGSELIEWSTAALQRLETLSKNASGEQAQHYTHANLKAQVLLSLLNLFFGQLQKANALADEAIALLHEDKQEPILIIVAHFVKGQAGYFLEDPHIEQLISDSLTELQNLGNHPASAPMMSLVLLLSAEVAARSGDQDLAEQRLAEAATLLDKSVGPFIIWIEFSRMLVLRLIDLNPDELRRQYERGIKVMRDNNSRRMADMVESDYAHRLRHWGDFDDALAIYRRMLVEWRELGHRAAMANVLENIAFIDRLQHNPARALKLLGAAERIREEIKQDMLRPEREEYERELAALKNDLSGQELENLWAAGRSLSTDEVIALAIDQA